MRLILNYNNDNNETLVNVATIIPDDVFKNMSQEDIYIYYLKPMLSFLIETKNKKPSEQGGI